MILQIKIWKDRIYICDVFPFDVYRSIIEFSSNDKHRVEIIDEYLMKRNYDLRRIEKYENGYLLHVDKQMMVDTQIEELTRNIRY
jgi:uncharacterized protein YPO0396